MNAFCGNMLEVMDGSGRPCMVMSHSPIDQTVLQEHGRLFPRPRAGALLGCVHREES